MKSEHTRFRARSPRLERGPNFPPFVLLLLGLAMVVAPGRRLLADAAASPVPAEQAAPGETLSLTHTQGPSASDDSPSTTAGPPPAPPEGEPSNLIPRPSGVGPQSPAAAQAIVSWEWDQVRPAVAYGSGLDEYLVVWEDHHWANGSDRDIHGRRVSTSGAGVGGLFGISWDGNLRLAPDVAHNYVEQDYLVVWEYEYSTTDHDIWGRLVDWDGSLIGSEFSIATPTAYDRNPVVAYSPYQDSYLVVWEQRVGDPEFVVHAEIPQPLELVAPPGRSVRQ